MDITYDDLKQRVIAYLKQTVDPGNDWSIIMTTIYTAAETEAIRAGELSLLGSLRSLFGNPVQDHNAKEIYWDLVRAGVVTPGGISNATGYPFFFISDRGRFRLETL